MLSFSSLSTRGENGRFWDLLWWGLYTICDSYSSVYLGCSFYYSYLFRVLVFFQMVDGRFVLGHFIYVALVRCRVIRDSRAWVGLP